MVKAMQGAFVECYSGLMGGGKSFNSLLHAAEHIASGGVVYSNIIFKLDPWFNDAYSEEMKSFWLPECFEGCRKELHIGGLVLPVMRRNKDGKAEFEYNSRGLRHYLKTVHKWNYQDGQYHYLEDDEINADLPSKLPEGSQSKAVMVILDEALDHFEAGSSSKNANAEFRSFLRHIRKLGIHLIFIAQDFGSLDPKIRALTHFVWKFRDMHTWPVPILNRPLPKPWGDHIVAEQYHKSQFGKAKSEPINKNT
ncbi:zonular occludens toxin domain-containing protein, partial [Pontiellaceae bacterium B12219]|nr:zonular occludens toxin domain-containing protein [Pontiellaceae bacterium B12219]